MSLPTLDELYALNKTFADMIYSRPKVAMNDLRPGDIVIWLNKAYEVERKATKTQIRVYPLFLKAAHRGRPVQTLHESFFETPGVYRATRSEIAQIARVDHQIRYLWKRG